MHGKLMLVQPVHTRSYLDTSSDSGKHGRKWFVFVSATSTSTFELKVSGHEARKTRKDAVFSYPTKF